MLDGFVSNHAGILSKHVIGKSYQQRDIVAYRLGTSDESKPLAMITSELHAREPATVTVVLYFLGHVLEKFLAEDPLAVYIVESRITWIVPFTNPDSYIAIDSGGKQAKMIRKNARVTCDKASRSGVDLNRNFGFHWEKKFPKCDEEYQGEAPFSEPETQALKHLTEDHAFSVALNFHSFGQMLTHPFNFAKSGKVTLPEDDQRIFDEISEFYSWRRHWPLRGKSELCSLRFSWTT